MYSNRKPAENDLGASRAALSGTISNEARIRALAGLWLRAKRDASTPEEAKASFRETCEILGLGWRRSEFEALRVLAQAEADEAEATRVRLARLTQVG